MNFSNNNSDGSELMSPKSEEIEDGQISLKNKNEEKEHVSIRS